MAFLQATQRVKYIKRWWQGGYFRMDERPAAETDLVPFANSLHFYAKDKAGVSALYWRDDAGVEHEVATGATVITDHGGLTGLGDDDHSIYLLAAGTRALTGDWTTGAFNINIGGGAAANELRFLEPSGSGSNYTGFKAQAQAASVTYTLPAADATVSGYALTSDAAGTLSWLAAGVSDHGALTGLSDDDHAQYALLAGRSGGQLLKGGTAVTDFLALQSTAGVGTTDYIKFLVGNNGATEAMRINNVGRMGLGIATDPDDLIHLYSTSDLSLRVQRNTNICRYGPNYMGTYSNSDFSIVANTIPQWAFKTGGSLVFNTVNSNILIGGTTFGIRDHANVGYLLYIDETAKNISIGGASVPSTGTMGLIFGDGTALATMASNTAGLYADDIAGNVSMHAINENGDVIKLIKGSTFTQTYATADATLGAYTADDESAAYTGIDNAQAGTPYAQLTDLNALRTAYETLRAFTEDAVAMLNTLVDDHQTNGMAG